VSCTRQFEHGPTEIIADGYKDDQRGESLLYKRNNVDIKRIY